MSTRDLAETLLRYVRQWESVAANPAYQVDGYDKFAREKLCELWARLNELGVYEEPRERDTERGVAS